MTYPTQTGGAALARCVACSAETFSAEHWDRAPLLSRAGQLDADFSDLFSADAVDELVSERGLRTPFLRMARDGNVRPAGGYTRGGGAGAGIADQAADDKILTAIDDGSTLVLQGLHRTWPPLVELGARLADELGHPVQINAYITPPQNQGFAPHHDTHDVFVLQIAGAKHWVVHRPVLEDPLDSQAFDRYKGQIAERVATESPLIDTELEPGDCLYLPRGTLHSATARGETSIHLTIGVHPLTRHQIVRLLCDAVVEDAELRRSLPMGVDLADPDVLEPEVTVTIAALARALERVEVDAIAQRIGENLMTRTRPEPVRPLAQLAAARDLTLDTALRRREALRHRLVASAEVGAAADRGETLALSFLDRRVELAAGLAPGIEFALSGERFTPAELPGLDPDDQLELARRLLREGVLVPA